MTRQTQSRYAWRLSSAVWLALLAGWSVAGSTTAPIEADDASVWYERAADGDVVLHLYFFWSEFCPHCHDAKPFVEALAEDHSWLRLHSFELSSSEDHVERYIALAQRIGERARSVPAFLYCERMDVGFDDERSMGRHLLDALRTCRDRLLADASTGPADEAIAPLTLPWVGEVDATSFSLPAYTVMIAAIDAFNPCAFFVLLFLLGLLVHARDRSRMLIIGGVFVLFSGLVYFVFMSAWLNVFMLLGEARVLTLSAGLVAIVVAGINIKDYFRFKRGVSLTLTDSARTGLFARMRRLLRAESLPATLVGTVTLALLANSYELLCTAGFPMVYTRILTLHDLSAPAYYLYLAAYNVVYVTPLATIVVVFTMTLGARKLTEHQGRVLKLVSGSMMLGLGMVLVFVPSLLSNVQVALGLLLVTAAVAAAVVVLHARRERV